MSSTLNPIRMTL